MRGRGVEVSKTLFCILEMKIRSERSDKYVK